MIVGNRRIVYLSEAPAAGKVPLVYLRISMLRGQRNGIPGDSTLFWAFFLPKFLVRTMFFPPPRTNP
ncbi:MAG: hypothetical protein ACKN85_15345, partial [Pirellula sp.]